jgi:hypothetical protein
VGAQRGSRAVAADCRVSRTQARLSSRLGIAGNSPGPDKDFTTAVAETAGVGVERRSARVTSNWLPGWAGALWSAIYVMVLLLWLVTAADLLVMVYMYALPSAAVAGLTLVSAVWLVAEAIGWGSGLLAVPLTGVPPRESSGTWRRPAAAATLTEVDRHAGSAQLLRASLVLMSLGMAYMLLVMQFGTAPGGMPPGRHMSGM